MGLVCHIEWASSRVTDLYEHFLSVLPFFRAAQQKNSLRKHWMEFLTKKSWFLSLDWWILILASAELQGFCLCWQYGQDVWWQPTQTVILMHRRECKYCPFRKHFSLTFGHISHLFSGLFPCFIDRNSGWDLVALTEHTQTDNSVKLENGQNKV